MGRIFGTDGVRGVAGGDLSIELAMNIGKAAGMVVEKASGRQPTFLVGKDTRISSDMLEAALSAGLCSAGANVVQLGVVPTPAVAYLVTKYGAQAGVMLSASHNPYEYNGIKIFNGQGFKLRDEQEDEIERIVLDGAKTFSAKSTSEFGVISYAAHAVDDYVEHLKSSLPVRLDGMRVAIDCANGSASVTAKKLFEGMGAACDIIHAEPDGININWNCGSTHIDSLATQVRMKKYDLGLAFDGDADRCLAVDEQGRLVDGDKLLAMFAYQLKCKGKLKNNTLVATVMSNLGLYKFAEKYGILTSATKVGDRYVLQEMLERDFCVGGEQSGHIIFSEYMTTGDGQLSGLQLMGLLKESGQSLSQAASIMQVFPQTLLNIRSTPRMKQSLEDPEVVEAIQRENRALDGNGRILVRPSGTEPLIRIMVEGQDIGEIEATAKRIADVIAAKG